MALESFFFPANPDAASRSPTYEVEGPLDKGDPVHENLTLLVLRQAIELRQGHDASSPLGSLLKGIGLESLPNWDSTRQHKFDPKDAPESTQEFLRGVYWPDDPKCYFFKTIRGVKKYTSGLEWYAEFRRGKRGTSKTPEELIARSHFGDLQFLHAMACSAGEPPEGTRRKILYWARINVDVALGNIGPRTLLRNIPEHDGLGMKRFFSAHWDWTVQQLLAGRKEGAEELSAEDVRRRATGVLLHLLQDSYASGHLQRTEAGAIQQFHDYGQQDSHRHGRKDKMGPGRSLLQHLENTPGAMQAIAAGAHVVMQLDSMTPAEQVMEYLEKQVFQLATDVQSAGPGAEFISGKHRAKRPGLGSWSVQASPTDLPGSWRGGPETPIGQTIAVMIDKMRGSEAAGITLKGDTVESLFTRAILNNKFVTNEMLMKLSKVALGPANTQPEEAKKKNLLVANTQQSIDLALTLIPNARHLPAHKFTVSLMAAATAMDEKTLSNVFPDLGMSGHQSIKLPFRRRFFWAATTERVQRSTALHDFTDYLRSAGITGLNEAVWRVESRMWSALNSIVPGLDRY